MRQTCEMANISGQPEINGWSENKKSGYCTKCTLSRLPNREKDQMAVKFQVRVVVVYLVLQASKVSLGMPCRLNRHRCNVRSTQNMQRQHATSCRYLDLFWITREMIIEDIRHETGSTSSLHIYACSLGGELSVEFDVSPLLPRRGICLKVVGKDTRANPSMGGVIDGKPALLASSA